MLYTGKYVHMIAYVEVVALTVSRNSGKNGIRMSISLVTDLFDLTMTISRACNYE